MSKSRLIRFSVQEHRNGTWQHIGEWRSREMGKPTNKNLQAYRAKFIESTRKGGCNEHLGLGNIGNLRIQDFIAMTIKAEYTAPLFEVVG